MERLKKLLRQVSDQLRSMNPRSRLAAGVLLLLVVAGAVWLAASTGDEQLVSLETPSLSPEQLSQAVRALEAGGIPARVESGELVVPSPQALTARSILREQGLLSAERRSAFEEVADRSDIWSTRATTEKRWQAAKMATLQHLIEDFPVVSSATVIIEPGSSRSLGGDRPRAAVTVRLHDGAAMTGELIGAIADLVAGSVSGMDRSDVRVVDSRGAGYVADRDAPDDTLARLRLAEEYYRQRIVSALRYIDDVIVSVDVESDGDGVACRSAAVSLPRSYLRTAIQASPQADNSSEAASKAELADVRSRVARAAGVEPESVHVDWYRDVTADAAPGVKNTEGDSAARTATAVLLLFLAGVAGGLFAWRRLVRRNRPAADNVREDQPSDTEGQSQPFAFCCEIPIEQLQAALRSEHPQTVAVVLSYLPQARSAAVLASLEPDRRVEVVRRIAATRQVDAHTLGDVADSLRRRLESGETQSIGGGVSAAAGILRHVGGAAEQAVLDALRGEAPDLAGSIQRELMAFGDIERLPLRQWSEALESLSSEDLAVALRTANRRLRRRVLGSVSTATSRRVREQMERIGPVRLSDVEAAQQRVVDAVRRHQGGQYHVEAAQGFEEAPTSDVGQNTVISESS